MFPNLRSRSIKTFEKLSDGKVALYTYDLFRFLIGNDRFTNKSFNYGFKSNFKKGNLKLAYKYKIEHAVRFEKKAIDNNLISMASNYLDILDHGEVLKCIPLKGYIKKYLGNRKNNKKIIRRSKPRTLNFLYCGPVSKWDQIDHNEYDYIIFNKPLINLDIDIPDEKLIIVLNNMWSLKDFGNLTFEWGKDKKAIQFFSPNKLGLKLENNAAFKIFPKYLNASPMGLQRTLSIIFNHYDVNTIKVIGADFELSKIRYEKWYPRAKIHLKQNGFVLTNMIHDFLFNFLFTKKIKEESGGRLNGSIDYYLKMPLGDIINLFCKKVKTHY
tara:strand:- start:541 stop:1521 length:981 start_codon:yes stop_codon:yes gene_type:complete